MRSYNKLIIVVAISTVILVCCAMLSPHLRIEAFSQDFSKLNGCRRALHYSTTSVHRQNIPLTARSSVSKDVFGKGQMCLQSSNLSNMVDSIFIESGLEYILTSGCFDLSDVQAIKSIKNIKPDTSFDLHISADMLTKEVLGFILSDPIMAQFDMPTGNRSRAVNTYICTIKSLDLSNTCVIAMMPVSDGGVIAKQYTQAVNSSITFLASYTAPFTLSCRYFFLSNPGLIQRSILVTPGSYPRDKRIFEVFPKPAVKTASQELITALQEAAAQNHLPAFNVEMFIPADRRAVGSHRVFAIYYKEKRVHNLNIVYNKNGTVTIHVASYGSDNIETSLSFHQIDILRQSAFVVISFSHTYMSAFLMFDKSKFQYKRRDMCSVSFPKRDKFAPCLMDINPLFKEQVRSLSYGHVNLQQYIL